jgi:peptidylprolyl isomerase domain and WD repeat-containing protein 1
VRGEAYVYLESNLSQALYLNALPHTAQYEISFMHTGHVSHVLVTATDYLITGSVDGK